jgi:hypothetical protein
LAFSHPLHRGSFWSHLFLRVRQRLQAETLRKLVVEAPSSEDRVAVGEPGSAAWSSEVRSRFLLDEDEFIPVIRYSEVVELQKSAGVDGGRRRDAMAFVLLNGGEDATLPSSSFAAQFLYSL